MLNEVFENFWLSWNSSSFFWGWWIDVEFGLDQPKAYVTLINFMASRTTLVLADWSYWVGIHKHARHDMWLIFPQAWRHNSWVSDALSIPREEKKGGFAPRFRPSQVRGERADSRFPAAHPRGGGNELIPSVADAMNFVRQRSRIGWNVECDKFSLQIASAL